jgi:hypothetical protein
MEVWIVETWPLACNTYGIFIDGLYWVLAIGADYYSWHPDERFPTPAFIDRMNFLEKALKYIVPKATSAIDGYPLISKFYDVTESGDLILSMHQETRCSDYDKKMILDEIEDRLAALESAHVRYAVIRAILPWAIADKIVRHI